MSFNHRCPICNTDVGCIHGPACDPEKGRVPLLPANMVHSIDAAIHNAMVHGVGFLKDGVSIDPADVFIKPTSLEDILVWPCGTWCYREDLSGMSHMSDDYETLYCGSDAYEQFCVANYL